MTIKAKFKCNSVLISEGGVEFVCLLPVFSGSEENKNWSEYTPSGKLELSITAKGAVGIFKPGKEYLLDITAAE